MKQNGQVENRLHVYDFLNNRKWASLVKFAYAAEHTY